MDKLQRDYIGYDTTIIEIPEDFPNIYFFDYNSIITILYYYDQYSQECYNDSVTEFGIVTYCDTLEYYGLFNCWESMEYITKHKQPTFTDFMEWLKTKYK